MASSGTVRVRICIVSFIGTIALTVFLLCLMDTVNATANSSSFVILKPMILPLLAERCGVQKNLFFKTALMPRGSLLVSDFTQITN